VGVYGCELWHAIVRNHK